MPVTDTERITMRVPLNMGHLIGNTLRQYAMRGSHTWQIAAYNVGPRAGSYGFANELSFSCLDLLKGVLICNDKPEPGKEKKCVFQLKGNEYVCGDMKIVNLGNLGITSMNVCLVCASGTRTAEQNFEVAKRLCPAEQSDFVAVPSRHTRAIKFRYEVTPYDLTTEILDIEATAGVVNFARSAAIQSLQELSMQVQPA